jgi:hypothetical protein
MRAWKSLLKKLNSLKYEKTKKKSNTEVLNRKYYFIEKSFQTTKKIFNP